MDRLRFPRWTACGVMLASLLGAAGCDSIASTSQTPAKPPAQPPAVPIAFVRLSPVAATISVGGGTALVATFRDAAGNILNGRNSDYQALVWSSSAPAVASGVRGLITGIAAGTATITATTTGGVTGSAVITVVPVPVVPGTTVYQVSGIVSDETGAPVANSQVAFDYVTSKFDRVYSVAYDTTDAAGSYSVNLNAAAGLMKGGPPGTENAVAWAFAQRSDLESDFRYVSSTTAVVTQNFRLYRVRQIAPGDSALVTVLPDDPICNNDVTDPFTAGVVCRVIRVVAPAAGTLLLTGGGGLRYLEAQILSPGAPWEDWAYSGDGGLTVHVTPGTVVLLSLGIPWGAPAQSFMLRTSLSP